MAPLASKPTVLIVTGAWHTPLHYKPFVDLLSSNSFPVLCPCLPTCQEGLTAPYPDMHSDAEMIALELSRLIEAEGRDVLLAPHSYGGVPASQAARKSLAKSERKTAGKEGGIIGLFSICSFIVPSGTSLEALNGGKPMPFISTDEVGMTSVKDAEQLFFHDLDERERLRYASALVQQPAKAHASKIMTDPVPYKFLPTAVVFCDDDQATAPLVQKIVVENVEKDGGKIAQTYNLLTSHSPQLSKPQDLFNALLHFVESLQS